MSYSLNQLCTHSSFCQFWQRQGDHFSFFWSSDFCASVGEPRYQGGTNKVSNRCHKS